MKWVTPAVIVTAASLSAGTGVEEQALTVGSGAVR
jgi:hypothetical protein